MGDRNARRRRAVRLTDDALQVLHRRLIEEWDALELEGRLTRRARAALMQVCVGTSDRILDRKGNDRAVLLQAFECVGLEWDERFCEPMPARGGALMVVEAVAAPQPGAALEEPWRKARRPVLTMAVLSVLLLGTLLIAWMGPTRKDPEAPRKAFVIAWEAYHAGRYDDAKRQLIVAGDLAVRLEDVSVRAEVLRLEGEILEAEGRLTEAIARYEKALLLREEFRYDQARGSLLEVIGVAEAKRGRYEAAERCLVESYDILVRVQDWRGVAGTSRSLGSVAAATGSRARAREWFATAIDAMKEDPDPRLRTDISAQEAMLLCEDGETAEALAILGECLEEWEQRGHQRWRAKTQLQIAQVQIARGDQAASIAAAAEAKRLFAAVGDRSGVAQCASWLGEDAQGDRRS